jgi:Leucine Rich repeat
MSAFRPYITPRERCVKRRKLEEATTPATECDSSDDSCDDDHELWATGGSDPQHADGGSENLLQSLTEDTLGTIFFGGFLNSLEVVKSTSCVSKELIELAKTQVKMLDLRKCPHLTNSKLQIVVRRFTHLTVSISIHELDGVALLLQFMSLIFLPVFVHLFKQELDLSYCLGIDNINHLRHLRLLKILKLRGTCVSDVGIESWLMHPSAGNLEELDLSAVAVGQSRLITDRTANLLAVRQTHDLCEWAGLLMTRDRTDLPLLIQRSAVDPMFLSQLSPMFYPQNHCPLLKSLNLAWCRGITDTAVEHLAKLHEIADLDLQLTSVTDESCKILAKFTKLEKLDLSACNIGDVGLINLLPDRSISNLEILDLRFNVDITETSLKRLLTQTPKLEILNLQNCDLERTSVRSVFFPLQRRGVKIQVDPYIAGVSESI